MLFSDCFTGAIKEALETVNEKHAKKISTCTLKRTLKSSVLAEQK